MKLHICDNCQESYKTKKVTVIHALGYKERRDWCELCYKALLDHRYGELADRRRVYDRNREYRPAGGYVQFK
jgi:hypothetical protein